MSLAPQNYADPVVVMTTSLGTIAVELFPTKAPLTVNNFLSYVDSGFYAGTIFHRVVAGFVDQGGGYNTAYQAKVTQAPIPLESNNGLSNARGTIAMARTSDPNSATSQFYFNQVNNGFLDYTNASNPGYAVFGNTISGLNVIDAINAVQVDANSIPYNQIVIQSATSEVIYAGHRSDYTISMTGGVLAVTPNSTAPASNGAPTADTLSRIQLLQFSDLAVTPANDTVAKVLAGFGGGSAPTDVFDSSANVFAKLDNLQSVAAAGKLIAIGLTDSSAPTLALTGTQYNHDATAIAAITSSYNATITRDVPNDLIIASAGHANLVVYSGTSSQFQIGAWGDGATISVFSTGSTDVLRNMLQVQFTDKTVTLAANNSLNEGVSLLYQAAFARSPDLGGLSFWEQAAKALPSGLTWGSAVNNALADSPVAGGQSIAAYFTASSEFTAKYGSLSNSAFVTQLYTNVLDRAADSGGLNFWVGLLNNNTLNRQDVLVNFAESAEAVSNATQGFTGVSGAHAGWLVLI